MTGRLIAVVGPSGVGKDSVMVALAHAHPKLDLVRRYITRAAHLGGEDFTALSEAEFEEQKQRGDFILDWPAHGLRYGVHKDVLTQLAAGQDLLLNLSRAVLPDAQRAFADMQVFLITASHATLQARLSARGRESAADIQARLERATWPMPEGVDYTEISNDGTLEQTVAHALQVLYPEEDH